MYNPFTKHPNSVGEGYFTHMFEALKYAFRFQLLSMIIYIHALLPFLFESYVGDDIEKINKELQSRRTNGETLE
tara:strand:+ start:59 stop:280 length:222 start_codon:yes stop_codon:yes gene_type:complete